MCRVPGCAWVVHELFVVCVCVVCILCVYRSVVVHMVYMLCVFIV